MNRGSERGWAGSPVFEPGLPPCRSSTPGCLARPALTARQQVFQKFGQSKLRLAGFFLKQRQHQ